MRRCACRSLQNGTRYHNFPLCPIYTILSVSIKLLHQCTNARGLQTQVRSSGTVAAVFLPVAGPFSLAAWPVAPSVIVSLSSVSSSVSLSLGMIYSSMKVVPSGPSSSSASFFKVSISNVSAVVCDASSIGPIGFSRRLFIAL